MHKRSAAFTLIELIVVLVVMSLLATLTVMTFGGSMDRYRVSRAIETIEMFDAHIRREARASQQGGKVSIDRGSGKLSLAVSDRGVSRSFQIPSQVQITELRLVDASGRRRGGATVTNFDVASSGRTPTYAMRLERGKLSQWLVVLGFSGQVVSLETEGEVDALLAI